MFLRIMITGNSDNSGSPGKFPENFDPKYFRNSIITHNGSFCNIFLYSRLVLYMAQVNLIAL